jgi:signal transduction histidine kinase
MSAAGHLDSRVLLRTATGKDAVMAQAVLRRADIGAHTCASIPELIAELELGAGVLLVAEEALPSDQAGSLAKVLASQPAWSDIPVLFMARPGAGSRTVAAAIDLLPNVTIVERPTRIATLVSTVKSALRARQRQYAMRDVLASLREADQRKTEFLATLAHELRNPMAPLSTALAILAIKAPAPEAAKPYYVTMKRQLDHMVRLVNDLMEVSRITRGKIELQVEHLSLLKVLQDAVDLSRPLFDARGHHLRFHHVDPYLTVRGDPVRLAQVFSNLLNNAAKYTPERGNIDLSAEMRQPGLASISVRDNGDGLQAEMLTSIFDMFVQVSGTAKAAQGGLGIGLTLVKSLVDLHGGSVLARSDGLGLGSEFEVLLPTAEHGAHEGQAPLLLTRPLSFSGTVMIVDDNRDAADTLRDFLELLGARTVVAYSGQEALSIAAQARLEIAILDIGMPGMDGCELAVRLRAQEGTRDVALVALTGWGQASDRERIDAAGFQHHLLKPVDQDALLAVLRSASAEPS